MNRVKRHIIEFLSIEKHFSSNCPRVRVRVRNIYFDNEKHDIEETNTETFMCRSMSATIAYIELHMIKK